MSTEINNRAAALAWWRELPEPVWEYLAKKYRPTWTTEMVCMSTSTIFLIWTSETRVNYSTKIEIRK